MACSTHLLRLASAAVVVVGVAGCSQRSTPPPPPGPEAVFAAAADAFARRDLPAFLPHLTRHHQEVLVATWICAARHAERRQGLDQARVDALLAEHGCDPRPTPREAVARVADLASLFAALDRFVRQRWAPIELESWERGVVGRLSEVTTEGDRATGQTSRGRRCKLIREGCQWRIQEVR